MGSHDVPPSHSPPWLIPASNVLLAIGIGCWCAVYILMTHKALCTGTYGMPVVALVPNLAWEAVFFVLAATDGAFIEAVGLLLWLLCDLCLAGATVLSLSITKKTQRMARTVFLATALAVLAVAGHWKFAQWWLNVPGRGCGNKTGKFWHSQQGYDATELAFWTAGVCQAITSSSSLVALWLEQDTRGVSRSIWALRMTGSVVGLGFANGILWWHWPEAHCFFVQPLAMLTNGVSLVCDLVYGRVLYRLCRRARDKQQ